jgi:hypothetical protein
VCHSTWRIWTLCPVDSTKCHNQSYSMCLSISLHHWLHSAIQIHIPLRRDSSNCRNKTHMNLECSQEWIHRDCIFHPRGQRNDHWIVNIWIYVKIGTCRVWWCEFCSPELCAPRMLSLMKQNKNLENLKNSNSRDGQKIYIFPINSKSN